MHAFTDFESDFLYISASDLVMAYQTRTRHNAEQEIAPRGFGGDGNLKREGKRLAYVMPASSDRQGKLSIPSVDKAGSRYNSRRRPPTYKDSAELQNGASRRYVSTRSWLSTQRSSV